ncbi:carbonic anhydrase [Anaerobacillus isosaccharinicus]|uniref:carbonic anhydrase n=1 Tax=Anaerobacillus isosaccharinicus TaxID=1532552 RepID=A0A1S2MFP6_9BACI|nr:carbonic anhydrase [Anaerobacillus isosaccharinicus]MBA5585100.1 carbonate dehydratase [Anaerobacillus isosaccharinicus]QOY36556.1 carbonate dehydratase [Anaerobacillus isosaccharinicus]
MEMFELTKNNEDFIRKIKENDPNYFEKLKQGQTPEFFVIACSDSRVSPSIITQLPLGAMFIHRNIGNQVDANDESFTASLYYALVHLKVKKIVIKGHTDCGGVRAAWSGVEDIELVGWLNKIRVNLPVDDQHCKLTLDELGKENLLNQITNLKNHPVYKKYGKNVDILGALFHVESGELEWVTSPN